MKKILRRKISLLVITGWWVNTDVCRGSFNFHVICCTYCSELIKAFFSVPKNVPINLKQLASDPSKWDKNAKMLPKLKFNSPFKALNVFIWSENFNRVCQTSQLHWCETLTWQRAPDMSEPPAKRSYRSAISQATSQTLIPLNVQLWVLLFWTRSTKHKHSGFSCCAREVHVNTEINNDSFSESLLLKQSHILSVVSSQLWRLLMNEKGNVSETVMQSAPLSVLFCHFFLWHFTLSLSHHWTAAPLTTSAPF